MMVQVPVKFIQPDAIDTQDDYYRISMASDISRLVDSIRHIGMINFPILEKKDKRYRVVCGFKRIFACRILEIRQIPCRVIEDKSCELDCLKLAIADNAMSVKLTLMEEARAVVKLMRVCDPEDNLPAIAAPLGIDVSMELAEKYIRLCKLPEFLQELTNREISSMAIVLELGRMDSKSSAAMAGLFKSLRPTASQQKEMLEHLRSVAVAADKNIPAILKSPPVSCIIKDDSLDRKLKIRRLKHEIRKLRYPHITAFESSFYKNLKNLNLQNGLVLVPPENFENTVYSFTLSFKTVKELKQKADTLQQISETHALSEILKREIEDK